MPGGRSSRPTDPKSIVTRVGIAYGATPCTDDPLGVQLTWRAAVMHRVRRRGVDCATFLSTCAHIHQVLGRPVVGLFAPSLGGRQLRELGSTDRGLASVQRPTIKDCVPDYGASAVDAKAGKLPVYQARLKAMDPQGWTPAQKVDAQLVTAEMNGLDFDLRVRRPWARNPVIHTTVFGERSDVPQHEGVRHRLRLTCSPMSSRCRAPISRGWTCLLGAIPALLQQARINLRHSNARDLWVYGIRTVREQEEVLAHLQTGTLDMRTRKAASMRVSQALASPCSAPFNAHGRRPATS